MIEVPKTRYAKSGDLHIAYQVIGDGPVDLIMVPGWASHIEVIWEEPQAAAFLRRLAEFSRLILFDKRGTGMSDPVMRAAPVDEHMDDISAVMDAVGSERGALFGYSEGGPIAMIFAAIHPDRVTAVIPYGTTARTRYAPDYPCGFSDEYVELFLDAARQVRFTGDAYDTVVPSRRGDLQFREWFARYTRLAATPAMLDHLLSMAFDIDIRSLLPSIRTPTLVLHRTGDRLVPVEHGRYLAQHIPGARYVELEGADHWPWFGDTEKVVEEVEELLTGARHVPTADRVLATVMFTDIVGSTERLAQLGDRSWRQLLDQHDALASRQVERFRGRTIKQTGDGVLATFDRPAHAVQCARAVQEASVAIGLEVRAGLHVGECEIRGDDIGGIAVHIAARINSLAESGEVLVSRTVKDLVAGSGIRFVERGSHALKGVPDEWQLYAVEN